MEPERHETYERIPWETLESKPSDRNWLVYAIAGAVAVGALAYSFARSQPVEVPAAAPSIAPAAVAPGPAVTSPPATVTSPIVVSEADLFAVEPDAFARLAAAHAELAAVAYISADGVESLLPADLPPPELPPGTSVFVDWAGTSRVTEIDQLNYEVDVSVRSLRAQDEGPFVRQPTLNVSFLIGIDNEGAPYVRAAPTLEEASFANGHSSELAQPPADLVASVEVEHGPVVGGTQLPDGRWSVVVMELGPDGVSRPATIYP